MPATAGATIGNGEVCLHVQELVLSSSAYLGRQMEVIAAFSMDVNASTGNSTTQNPFAVGLQLNTGNGTYTRISINGTAAALQTGGLQILQVIISHLVSDNWVMLRFRQPDSLPADE